MTINDYLSGQSDHTPALQKWFEDQKRRVVILPDEKISDGVKRFLKAQDAENEIIKQYM